MEDFTEVVFKKASDVTIDDVDSAALVYFSRYLNTYRKGLADAKYGSTLATVSNWTSSIIVPANTNNVVYIKKDTVIIKNKYAITKINNHNNKPGNNTHMQSRYRKQV